MFLHGIRGQHSFEKFCQVDGLKLVEVLAAVRPGKLEDLFHHASQSPHIIANHHAALLDFLPVPDQSIGQILADRVND